MHLKHARAPPDWILRSSLVPLILRRRNIRKKGRPARLHFIFASHLYHGTSYRAELASCPPQHDQVSEEPKSADASGTLRITGHGTAARRHEQSRQWGEHCVQADYHYVRDTSNHDALRLQPDIRQSVARAEDELG
jgi:hypothetical protein